jgi:hypothetical protein
MFEDMFEDILKEFEKRIPQDLLLPEEFFFRNVGDTIIGQFIRKIEFTDTRGRERIFYVIRKIDDSKEYCIRQSSKIKWLWTVLDIKPTDYVMIKYMGERELPNGRTQRLFVGSKMTEEEFNELTRKFKQIKEKHKEKQVEKQPKAEEKKPIIEEMVIPKEQAVLEVEPEKIYSEERLLEEKYPQETIHELREYLKKTMRFIPQISYVDFLKRLKVRGFNMPIEDIKQYTEDFLVFNDESRIVKFKE